MHVNEDFFDEILELAEEVEEVTPSGGDELTKLVRHAQAFEVGSDRDWRESPEVKALVRQFGDRPPIKMLEDLVAYYKKEKQRLLVHEIPSVLEGLGVSEVVTQDGFKVKMTEKLSVSTKNKRRAIKWLENNGFADAIKERFNFGKGANVEPLIEWLEQKGYSFNRDEWVEPQTLKRIVKEAMEEGIELPGDDVINVSSINLAEIK